MRMRLLGAVVGLVGLSTALMGIAPAGAGPSGAEKKFCKAVVDITLFFNTVEEEPTDEDEERIAELLEPIEQNAPPELADQVSTAVSGTREGNFEDPAYGEAVDAIDQWVADNCGYQVVEVTGTEFAFEGIPGSLKTGVTIFRFTNAGAELHELVVSRIKGDESLEELLELPDDEVEGKVQFLGAGFADQGQSDFTYVNLKKPGRYAAVCFLPVGSTDEAAAETAEGPPHALEGMATEFKVKKK